MRKKNVSRNVFLTAISKIIGLLIGFVSRKLIISWISIEFLGLNSLYANLLDLLNLAELGLGVAIQVRLYAPLVNQDYEKVSYLLSIAKKIYFIIGVIVLGLGLILSFFLKYIIKDNPFEMWYIQTAFIISIIGISLSYLCADKRLFFESNEKYYLITISDIVTRIISVTIGLIVLYFTREYLYYAGIITLQLFVSNVFMWLLFKIKYSKYSTNYKYSSDDASIEKEEIKKNMKDVVPMKLGVFVFSSTDSIVISTFLGLSLVAIYSNYNLIFISMLSFSSVVSTALVSTFGKIEKENPDKENLYRKYRVYSNIQFMFSSFTAVCILLLIDKFMFLWVGDGLYIGQLCLILFVSDYFIHSLFQPLSTLYTSTGKFKQDKICMIISASMNIIISIILVNFIGLAGVIIGTLSANIFTYFNRAIVMDHFYFGKSIKSVFIRLVIQILIFMLEILVCYYSIKNISFENKWIEFILCGIICTMITNIVNVILFKFFGYFSLVRGLMNGKNKETIETISK